MNDNEEQLICQDSDVITADRLQAVQDSQPNATLEWLTDAKPAIVGVAGGGKKAPRVFRRFESPGKASTSLLAEATML